jgi:hypothetical protein
VRTVHAEQGDEVNRRRFMEALGLATLGTMLPGPLKAVAANVAASGSAINIAPYHAVLIAMHEALSDMQQWTTPIMEKASIQQALQNAVEPWAKQDLLAELMDEHAFYSDTTSAIPADHMRSARASFRKMSAGREKQVQHAIMETNKAIHRSNAPGMKYDVDGFYQEMLKQDQALLEEQLRIYSMEDAEFEQWLAQQAQKFTQTNQINAEALRKLKQSMAQDRADDVDVQTPEAFALHVQASRKLRGNGFNLQVKRAARGDGFMESPAQLAIRTHTMLDELADEFGQQGWQVENKDLSRGRVVLMSEKGSEIDAFLDTVLQHTQSAGRSAA